jgi:hypothetical protein
LRLSGEKAAAIALGRRNGVALRELVLQFVQIYTRDGESTVSERITVLLSGDMASTLPAAPINCEMLDPLNTMSPCAPKDTLRTPKYAFDPCASYLTEFGANGNARGLPALKAAVALVRVIGTMRAVQPWVVVLQAEVVA